MDKPLLGLIDPLDSWQSIAEAFEKYSTQLEEENERLKEFKQMVKDYHTSFSAKEQFRAIELLKGE